MNLDQIAQRITNPNSCLPSETVALQELTEKYPYAQVFSVLYLKALSLQNDIGFDEALQKHAYRITDRMKLYDLIHDKNQETEEISSESIEQTTDNVDVENTPIVLEPTTEIQAVENENLISAEDDDLLQEISSEILFETGLIDEKIESDQEIVYNPGVETIQESETYIESELEDQDLDSIDADPNLIEISEEIIKESNFAFAQSKEKIASKTIETEETNSSEFQSKNSDPDLDLGIISEIVETIYRDNLEQTIQEVEVVEKKSEIISAAESNSEIEISNSKMSFTSWLKSGSHSTLDSIPKEIIKPEIKNQVVDNEKLDLIENFIKTEPKISKVKKEFYSPSKKAKESISTEGLIYSETLAEIFAMQGNFPKAITAYQQLMLTNPEKKIFFAKRIEELKEKLNT